MRDIFKKPMETILEYDGFSFCSEIEVDDMKLAWELLSRTLDDDRLRLLETTRDMLAYDDYCLLGDEREAYAVISFSKHEDDDGEEVYEPECSILCESVGKAVDVYNDQDRFLEFDCYALVRAVVAEGDRTEIDDSLNQMVKFGNVAFLAIKTYR